MTEIWTTEKFREHQTKKKKRVTGQRSLFNRKQIKKARGPGRSQTLESVILWLVSEYGLSEEDLEIMVNRVESEIKDAGERTDWCLLIHLLITGAGYDYERHARIHKDQHYGFDFLIKNIKLALSVDGGQWIPSGGRHQRGEGWRIDTEDRNLAFLNGYRVIVFVTDHFTKTPMYIVSTLREIFR